MSDRPSILIVDDSPTIRAVFSAYLEEHGYRPSTASDGREGIDAFREARPDLILCDLRMPQVDGLEVLETVHAEDPDMPVVIISGSNDMKDAIQALKLGAWDYLLKPLGDMAALDHALSRSLERAALLAENRRYRRHLERANAELEESLRRLQEDEEAGRRVQFDLMPPEEDARGGLAFSRRVLPSSYLSGDFVDWFDVDADHVGFFVADVSGHGVSSAFVTVLLNSFADQALEAHRQGRDDAALHPAVFVERLNRSLLARKLAKSLTMFYAVVDRPARRLRYVNAGQFPFPIFHDGAAPRVLEARGFSVGHFDFATWEEEALDLPPIWSLALISDGVLEVMDAPSLADKEARLRALFEGPAGWRTTIDACLARLGLDARAELPDDITFLTVRTQEGVA